MSVELPIAAVVVHRDGALVERAGKVAATGGRAVIGGLPLLLDERSLRVEVGGASLLGVGQRVPVMHDGCAATLRDRFDASCGGTAHGNTSRLAESQLSDLVAYLESI